MHESKFCFLELSGMFFSNIFDLRLVESDMWNLWIQRADSCVLIWGLSWAPVKWESVKSRDHKTDVNLRGGRIR